MADGDNPSFQTTRELVDSNTELQWGGSDGKDWSNAIDTSTGVTITDSGSVQTGTDIPDSGIFQDAQYQFYAGSITASDGDSPVPFPESLAGLNDATAVGAPIYKADKNAQYDAVEYDATDDGHDWDGEDGSVTGDTWSIAALVWVASGNSSNLSVFSWGSSVDAYLIIDSSEQLSIAASTSDPARYGSVPTGKFATVGVSFDNGDYRFHVNGSNVGNESSGTPDSIDTGNIGLGYSRPRGSAYFNGFISEIIVSNSAESDQAFTDYHNDRLQ